MLGVFALIVFAVFLIFFYNEKPDKSEEKPKNPKYAAQMRKLWSIAQTSMKERKPLRAEKALLTILKFDEKNAAAYNRLGILYAKEQKFDDAIECFEIAQSLDNNPSSLHNAGLIYLETGAYEKAELAFEQALELEGDIPARYIALAKAKEQLGRRKDAISALESAYELDHSTTTLRQILALHEVAGDEEAIIATTARIEQQLAEDVARKRRARSKKLGVAKSESNTASTATKPKPRLAKPKKLIRPKNRKIIQ